MNVALDFLTERSDAATIAAFIVAGVVALIAVAVAASTGTRQTVFAYAVLHNATEEALVEEGARPESFGPLRQCLLSDLVASLAIGVLAALTVAQISARRGDGPVTEDMLGVAVWAALAIGVFGVLDNVLLLSAIRDYRWEAKPAARAGSGAEPRVAWAKANLAAIFGQAKVMLAVAISVVIALVAMTDSDAIIWWVLSVLLVVGVVTVALSGYVAADRRWRQPFLE